MDELWNRQLAEMMMDKYGSQKVSEIVNSPQFIAEFENWVEQMEKEFDKEVEATLC